MSTLHFHPTATEVWAAPRASRRAAGLLTALWHLAAALRRSLSRPAADATAEANHVRAIALDIRRSDPRFADDLFAAADRHERLHG